ncbi:MAG: metallophosphoesterase family protein, partial [Planctomycetota bacterium]
MRIGIMADSHDNIPMIDKAVDAFIKANCCCILHAGDIVSPFTIARFQKFSGDMVAVYGNNDGDKVGLSKLLHGQIYRPPHKFRMGGRKFLLAHAPESIKSEELEGIEIFIYGH